MCGLEHDARRTMRWRACPKASPTRRGNARSEIIIAAVNRRCRLPRTADCRAAERRVPHSGERSAAPAGSDHRASRSRLSVSRVSSSVISGFRLLRGHELRGFPSLRAQSIPPCGTLQSRALCPKGLSVLNSALPPFHGASDRTDLLAGT